MIRRLEITPAADHDLEEIAANIGQDNPAAASRLVAAAMKAFNELSIMPNLGSRVAARDPRLKGLRRRTVPRFATYQIFYRAYTDMVQIVRVLHGARDIERILTADE